MHQEKNDITRWRDNTVRKIKFPKNYSVLKDDINAQKKNDITRWRDNTVRKIKFLKKYSVLKDDINAPTTDCYYFCLSSLNVVVASQAPFTESKHNVR